MHGLSQLHSPQLRVRLVPCALLFSLICLVEAGTDQLPTFTRLRDTGIEFVHISGSSDRKSVIPEAKGGGIGLVDFDGDGLLDLYLAQGSTVERYRRGKNPRGSLYRNLGGGRFLDVTDAAGLNPRGWGMGIAAADYDNDGDTDLYLTALGPNYLYRNCGDGTFEDVTRESRLGDPRWSTSAAFGDYDGDGDLDLYVSNYITLDFAHLPPANCQYRGKVVLCGPSGLPGAKNALYRNNGDGTFIDVTEASGAVDREAYYGLGCIWTDLDNDGDQDIVAADDATPNLAYINQGDGTFIEMGYGSGLAVSADGLEQASMGIDAGDFNNDGLQDIFMTHFSLEYSTLFQNRGDLLFEDITSQALMVDPEWPLVSWGTAFWDFNNDGWKDIMHSNGHVYPYLLADHSPEAYAQPKSFYLNQRDGTFRDVSGEVGQAVQEPEVSRSVAFGDFDNDGDIDLAVANMNGRPSLFRNDWKGDNHWIFLRARGVQSNRDGIGARITVSAGELTQVDEVRRDFGIYSTHDPRLHFGLGAASKVDEIKVRWPSGKLQIFKDVGADHHYLIHESEGLRFEFPARGSEVSRKTLDGVKSAGEDGT